MFYLLKKNISILGNFVLFIVVFLNFGFWEFFIKIFEMLFCVLVI